MRRARGVARGAARALACATACLALALAAAAASAQTRVMAIGDSITQGGQNHASYRYDLYFDLLAADYEIELVGSRDFVDGGGTPNPVDYPFYDTFLDRDHQAYWGWRTDQVEAVIQAEVASALPEIVLIHLGTNDIGQNGAAGVTAADQNLRDIIALIRLEVPDVVVLLARVIPIGAGSGYGGNAGQVGPLNLAIDAVAAAMDTAQSPVIVVDQNAGFDLLTMMQPDELHPNLLGERQMASVWLAALAPLLTPGNPAPFTALTTPLPGASFVAPADVALAATAFDPNGTIVEVRFHLDGVLQGADTSEPYTLDLVGLGLGTYVLTAVAEDDGGATRTSAPVGIDVVPQGGPIPIAVVNASFESPALPEMATESNSAVIPGWTFTGTANTFAGIFNPPAGSYPEAAGQGTPIGADGAQAAFLFNNGGPAESVMAEQVLGATVEAGTSYTLTVAIGRFDPGQPYVPSTYGGYTIELLAGATVIAWDTDSTDPPPLEFADAVAFAAAESIPPALVGQPLAIRLDISATEAARSTHFDDVRVVASPAEVPTASGWARLALVLLLITGGMIALRRTA